MQDNWKEKVVDFLNNNNLTFGVVNGSITFIIVNQKVTGAEVMHKVTK